MNSGIRAVLNLRKFGKVSLSNLRKKLRIPSIFEISESIVQKAAWVNRVKFLSQESSGPETRNRSKKNIPLPDERSWNGKLSCTMVVKAWNDLPLETKMCNDPIRAKYLIKRDNFNFNI